MSPLLIGFAGVLLLPLFVATWRASLLGLATQGLLMAVMAYQLHGKPHTASEWVSLVDLALLRGLLVPGALWSVLRARNAPPRSDVVPPNLLSWTFALGGVLVAFNVAEGLAPDGGDGQTLIAVSLAAVLLGFLVLATQAGTFAQMVGALRIENGIALFELGGARHEAPEIQVGQVVVLALTIGLFRWYLAELGPTVAPATEGPSSEEATL